jgi:hypothetical protein
MTNSVNTIFSKTVSQYFIISAIIFPTHKQKSFCFITVTDQMKVLERMLNILSENRAGLAQQRKMLEEKLMRMVKSHADAEEDKINKQSTDLQGKLDAITQALPQNDASTASAAALKSALLPNADVSQMQKETEREGQADFFQSFSLNVLQVPREEVLDWSQTQLNSGLLFGGVQTDTSVVKMSAQLQQQANMINDLAQKVALLSSTTSQTRAGRESRELLDEVRAIRDKNTILAQEVSVLQMEIENLRKDVAGLKTNGDRCSPAQLTSLDSEVKQLLLSVSQMMRDKAASKDLKQLQDKFNKMSKDVACAKSDASTTKKTVSSLESFQTKMCKCVYVLYTTHIKFGTIDNFLVSFSISCKVVISL